MSGRSRSRHSFQVPCTIAVEHTNEHFHAHLELDGNPPMHPGDKIRVEGAPVSVGFGESAVLRRTATVTRAGPLVRLWTRLRANLEVTELYEVSFTPGRR